MKETTMATEMDDVSGAMVPVSQDTAPLQMEQWRNEVFVTQEGRVVRILANQAGLSITVGESKPLLFTPRQAEALAQFFRGL